MFRRYVSQGLFHEIARFGGRTMLKKLLALVLLVGLVSLAGCLTKPIALVETVATAITHGDSSMEHYRAHYWTYYNDLQSLVDDWDKCFLRYDRNDPFSE
jgi:hypothetical protein